MSKLITTERLRALSMINRWGGWVKRNYSVLEHEVIGALTLRHFGYPYRGFLIHDHEESEFGDVIAPVKAVCTTTTYSLMVEDFNQRLWQECNTKPDGGFMDRHMAHAEHLTVAIRGDRQYDDVEPCLIVKYAANLIRGKSVADRDICIKVWKDLWNDESL